MLPLNLLRMQEEDLGKLRAEAAGVRQWTRLADEETDPELRRVRLSGAETHMRRMEQLAASIAETRRRLRAEGFDPGPVQADSHWSHGSAAYHSDGRNRRRSPTVSQSGSTTRIKS